jgi:hypothetical protein
VTLDENNPNFDLDWATNNTFVAAPPSGNRPNGFVPGTRPPAQWFNYLLRGLRAWINNIRAADVYRIDGPVCVEQRGAPPTLDSDLDSWTIEVGRIRALRLPGYVGSVDSGLNVVFADTDVADQTTYGGEPSLFPNAIYHVYLGRSGSAWAARVSRTPPEVLGDYPSEPAWRHVHAFVTDARGWPIAHVRTGSKFSYLQGGPDADDTAPPALLLTGGAAVKQVTLNNPGTPECLVPCSPWSPGIVHLSAWRTASTDGASVEFGQTATAPLGQRAAYKFRVGEDGLLGITVNLRLNGATPCVRAPFDDNIQLVVEGFEYQWT